MALYISASTWPASRATFTRTKENSPIWARPTPTRTAVGSGWPKSRTTAARITAFPTTTRATMRPQDRQVLEDRPRVDEAAHRDEEERPEHVAQRQQARQRLVRVVGLADQQAGEEGAEGQRQSHRLGQRGGAQPDGKGDEEEELGAPHAGELGHEGGNHLRDDVEEGQEDQRRLAERGADGEEAARLEPAERGQEDHEGDRGEVLDERDAHHDAAVPRVELPAVDEQTGEHHGATDGDHHAHHHAR